jgi:hypothetical protein
MKYKINQGLIKNVDKGRISILDTDKSSIYELNETAAFIFEGLIKGLDEETLINLLMREYQVGKIQIKNDVRAIIDDFLKKKIVLPSKSKK